MTINRAFKHVSELWRSRSSDFRGRAGFDSPSQFNSSVQTLLFNQSVAINNHGATSDDIRERNDPNDIWLKDLKKLENSYSNLYQRYTRIMDEEAYALAIERKANTMAVFYRFLTTIAVGLGIMGIYWLAHVLCIPMPLMRVPL